MQFCVALNNIYILGQTNFSTILNIVLQTCFKHLCSWKLMAANWMAKLLLKHFFNGVEKYCFSCRQAAPFHPLSWISDWVSQSSSVGVFKLHFFSNETNCDWIGQLCSYQETAETARPARSNHARLYVRQVDVGKMMVIVWLLLWTATISIIFLCSHIFCSYSWE